MSGRRLLIVIDSLMRNNGAHVATRLMITALRRQGAAVDLLLAARTDDVAGIEGISQYELKEPRRGIRWFVQGIYRRLKIAPVPKWVVDPTGRFRRLMRQYETVLVVGENSRFRHLVSGLKGCRKVVFIHTDYVRWKTSCGWAIEDARFDRQVYKGFDKIAVVGQPNADRFAAYYPEFKDRTCAFHNLFDTREAERVKSFPPLQLPTTTKLVTISRLECGAPKMTDRLVRVAGELKRRGCAFVWTVYGKGSEQDEARLKELAREEGVEDVLHFAGFTKRPCEVLSTADVHVLLSAFEGAPNVIYEAAMLGVPSVATDVGAVREMIEDGKTGLVVPNDEQDIVDRLEKLLKNGREVPVWKANLTSYRYDNDKVMREYAVILGL